jgi:ArsR family transcriptional regulator
VQAVLDETARGIAAQSPFADDAATLAAMPNRPGAPRCA